MVQIIMQGRRKVNNEAACSGGEQTCGLLQYAVQAVPSCRISNVNRLMENNDFYEDLHKRARLHLVHIDDEIIKICTIYKRKPPVQGGFGGLYWTRTSDPIDVNDVLYQLSQQTRVGYPRCPFAVIRHIRIEGGAVMYYDQCALPTEPCDLIPNLLALSAEIVRSFQLPAHVGLVYQWAGHLRYS